ncbi:MAG: hypothetical protein V1722_01530 [Candidatus Micrarchaeota archaeon]
MPFTAKEEKIIGQIPRHGYLTEPLKRHLLAGVAAGTIREGELVELGKRIKQHVADKKEKPEYEKVVAHLRELQRQALEKTPDAGLSHLLNGIPKAESTIARAAKATGKAIVKLVTSRRAPTTTRDWAALEKNVVSVQVVTAPKGETERFKVVPSKYKGYMERMLSKVTTRKNSYGSSELRADRIAEVFPGRPEMFHSVFTPTAKASADWLYTKTGASKTPDLLVEPVLEFSEAEREQAKQQITARQWVTVGSLAGHRIHVFERGLHKGVALNVESGQREYKMTDNEEQAIQLAKKMARFFKHDVQVVKHYSY